MCDSTEMWNNETTYNNYEITLNNYLDRINSDEFIYDDELIQEIKGSFSNLLRWECCNYLTENEQTDQQRSEESKETYFDVHNEQRERIIHTVTRICDIFRSKASATDSSDARDFMVAHGNLRTLLLDFKNKNYNQCDDFSNSSVASVDSFKSAESRTKNDFINCSNEFETSDKMEREQTEKPLDLKCLECKSKSSMFSIFKKRSLHLSESNSDDGDSLRVLSSSSSSSHIIDTVDTKVDISSCSSSLGEALIIIIIVLIIVFLCWLWLIKSEEKEQKKEEHIKKEEKI